MVVTSAGIVISVVVPPTVKVVTVSSRESVTTVCSKDTSTTEDGLVRITDSVVVYVRLTVDGAA